MSDKLPEWPEDGDASARTYQQEIEFLDDMLTAALARMEALAGALKELRALVRGECPSLLDEDSGGDARLDMEIDELLAACERRN